MAGKEDKRFIPIGTNNWLGLVVVNNMLPKETIEMVAAQSKLEKEKQEKHPGTNTQTTA